MLRKLRSSVGPLFLASAAALPAIWAAWGVGGVLSAATLVWMVWPGSPPPHVPENLPTAAEVKGGGMHAVSHASAPLAPAVLPPKAPPQPPPTTAVVAQPATKVATPAKSDQEVFSETFFDPRFKGLDARYSHEVKLTPAQVKELTDGIDALEHAGNEFERTGLIYVELDAWVTKANVEEAFYARIKSGKGFRFPDLVELWTKYADKSGPELNLPEYVTQGYYRLRIANLKAAIVRGRATEGDVKFVRHAIGYVNEMRNRMSLRLQNARRLEGYLKAEGMIGENPAVVAQQRGQSYLARERWQESLQKTADAMMNHGDPGRQRQLEQEQDQADANRLMFELRGGGIRR
jgi:hypothetical protein